MKKLLTVLLSAIMAAACVGFSVTVLAAEGEDAQTGSSLGLYTKETLNISNWWYAGNIITPDKFDTPAEQPVNGGAAGFAIPEEYGYLLFDIEVPDSIPLIIDIKTGANWLEWKFIPDALYYVRADGATAFTEAKINEKGELYLENFTGTVAVPFASYETTTADGYTINSLGIYQIVFHNTLGIAEDNDGYWNSKVSNLMLADEDYVFAPVQSTSESKNLGLYTKETLNISNWWYEGNVINPETARLVDYIHDNFTLSQKNFIALGLILKANVIRNSELNEQLQLPNNERLRGYIEPLLDNGIIVSSGRGKGTKYSINPKLVNSAKSNIPTTLKTIEPYRLKELIREDLKYHPFSSVEDISKRLPDADLQELTRLVRKMANHGDIVKTGGRKYRKYRLP